MGWVYYPAVVRRGTGRRFGNAILSRWPIVDDDKLILPRVSVFGRMQRIATAATLDVGGVPLRVYSVHLATPVDLSLRARNDQFRAILDDAAPHPRVIIGGDMNSGAMPRHAERRGFHWATEEGPRTAAFGRWDHIVYRGLAPAEPDPSGTILDPREASDHRPVWIRAVLR
jgi:endonuclease/exonuclease/phosphatase family metal-dependent hydrolase